MNEFEQQVLQIQKEVETDEPQQHSGQSAEEAYATRLQRLSITGGEVHDGKFVMKTTLERCLLWIEIIREKCALPVSSHLFVVLTLSFKGKARSTSVSKTLTTSFSRSGILSSR